MTEPVVIAKDIVKSYRTPSGALLEVLKGASVCVAQGEHVALVGKSGSGKSTILHILGGLDKPRFGSVHICGNDLNTCSETKLAEIRAKKIGFVFQSFQLLPEMNILENVMLPAMAVNGGLRRAVRERAVFLLKRVGLAERAAHLPCELSGGEQQRAAVARALMNSPSVILADEPTGNLDAVTGSEIIECLFHAHTNDFAPAVVMVTHSENSAARCDRILRLENGVLRSDSERVCI